MGADALQFPRNTHSRGRSRHGHGDHEARSDRLFASTALLARENHELDSTMTALAEPNNRSLGAGVSRVVFTSVTVTGNTATVVAQAHEWTKAVTRQQAGGRWLDLCPQADKVYNAKFSIGPAGTWLVTDMIGRFANGSGP